MAPAAGLRTGTLHVALVGLLVRGTRRDVRVGDGAAAGGIVIVQDAKEAFRHQDIAKMFHQSHDITFGRT